MVEKPRRSVKEQTLPLKKTHIFIGSKELASGKPFSREASRNIHSKQAFLNYIYPNSTLLWQPSQLFYAGVGCDVRSARYAVSRWL